MRSRTYSLIILIPLLALASAALLLMFYIQPNFDADLTRIGGFTNREFGWNIPQKITADDSITMAKDLADNAAYHDVVVIGDSFSHFEKPRLNRWQQIFSSAAGTSLVTYHFKHVWLDDYLNSAAFNEHPPRILVMEFVERNIEAFVKAGRLAECANDEVAANNHPLTLENRSVAMLPLRRPTGIASLEEAMNYLRVNAKGNRKVNVFPLTTTALFSSNAADQLLTLRDDQLKYRIAKTDIARLGCYLLVRQQRAEANGITHFVVMVPPDKTSLYCPFIKLGKNMRCDSLVNALFVPGLHAIRLDRQFNQAVQRGEMDVYLPNDTHWGYRGSELAAQTLQDWFSSLPSTN